MVENIVPLDGGRFHGIDLLQPFPTRSSETEAQQFSPFYISLGCCTNSHLNKTDNDGFLSKVKNLLFKDRHFPHSPVVIIQVLGNHSE